MLFRFAMIVWSANIFNFMMCEGEQTGMSVTGVDRKLRLSIPNVVKEKFN